MKYLIIIAWKMSKVEDIYGVIMEICGPMWMDLAMKLKISVNGCSHETWVLSDQPILVLFWSFISQEITLLVSFYWWHFKVM